MGSLGILEFIVLFVIGILVFGGDLPEVGRKLGRIWGKIQHYVTLLQEDIEQETSTIQDRIELDEAHEEPYVSRQQSPETTTPETSEEPEFEEHSEEEWREEEEEKVESTADERDDAEDKSPDREPDDAPGNT